MAPARPWTQPRTAQLLRRPSERFRRGDRARIAVFRTAEDHVFALEDRCPHKGGPLSQGIVHGGAVTCPLHNMVISLETGQAMGADEGQVRTFKLEIDGETILIDTASLEALAA